ncbi:helix-turn-helix transcriptional regulator [Metapseudomonas resinovorans]|uniref:helix-turn-helix transcriptional regulator n=1 Tax=Metapseudomonas resinovorans TaxID=53412 RepID=UPI000987AA13|nr:LuxR C-terminal-related transcriptional regulator [Pseudomonas resinovorans]GLZ85589.1 helix-turn-helix transcriptional regulator [Pseudomonas resinovorans]
MHDDFGLHCLHAFSRVVPASCFAFYRVDPQLRAHDFQLLRMDARTHRDYLDHYRDFDPLQPALCRDERRAVVPLREAMARQARDSQRIYQGFLARHGIRDVVEVIAHDHQRPVVGISLLRTGKLSPFDAEELQRLDGLRGLLDLAVRQLPEASPESGALAAFTPREQEIALLLREGLCNKDLARQLDLGLATVKTHLIHLFRKTGARSRTELVRRLFP